MREIDDSLRRLGTDHIDIYQVHWPDPGVPVEETAEAMLTLFKRGTIRAIGVSNFSVAEMDRFRRVAPIHVLQSPYNISERGIEADVLPYCHENRIATFGYGAGARHPGQLQPVDGVIGWSLDAAAKAEVDRILRQLITDPVGPEFMAPPARS